MFDGSIGNQEIVLMLTKQSNLHESTAIEVKHLFSKWFMGTTGIKWPNKIIRPEGNL